MAKRYPINVVVIGFSGQYDASYDGVGKSCLCSRLVNPGFDQYQAVDTGGHSSVYSHREFQQKIINYDHYLWHGAAERKLPGQLLEVSVVEHTEILDGGQGGRSAQPTPFQPPNFKPYIDRALSNRMSSTGKKAYVNHDRTCRAPVLNSTPTFPSDFRPTHYILVMDPTAPPQLQQMQRSQIALICTSLGKNTRKAVLAITKCDQLAPEKIVQMERENEHLGGMFQIPVICVSAHNNININELLLILSTRQRTRGVHKTPSFTSAMGTMHHRVEQSKQALTMLMRYRVNVFEVQWESVRTELAQEEAFTTTCELAGVRAARTLFQERLVEIKLDSVKARVREEARTSQNSNYGELAQHLLLERAEDIRQSLSTHPEFADSSTDISPYMKVTRDQLRETLGVQESEITTTVSEGGYVRFVRPQADKKKPPPIKIAIAGTEPAPPHRGTYETHNALQKPELPPQNSRKSPQLPPPLPGEMPPTPRKSYEAATPRRLPSPGPADVAKGANKMETAPTAAAYGVTGTNTSLSAAAKGQAMDQPRSPGPHYKTPRQLPVPKNGPGSSSTLPASSPRLPPASSNVLAGSSATLPAKGRQSPQARNSGTLPSPSRRFTPDFSVSPRLPNEEAVRPAPVPRPTQEEERAAEVELEMSRGYLPVTCNGAIVEDVTSDNEREDPYGSDQVYDAVDHDDNIDDGVEGDDEDGNCVYVRSNDARTDARTLTLEEEIEDAYTRIGGARDGNNAIIDPYSEFKSADPGTEFDTYSRVEAEVKALPKGRPMAAGGQSSTLPRAMKLNRLKPETESKQDEDKRLQSSYSPWGRGSRTMGPASRGDRTATLPDRFKVARHPNDSVENESSDDYDEPTYDNSGLYLGLEDKTSSRPFPGADDYPSDDESGGIYENVEHDDIYMNSDILQNWVRSGALDNGEPLMPTVKQPRAKPRSSRGSSPPPLPADDVPEHVESSQPGSSTGSASGHTPPPLPPDDDIEDDIDIPPPPPPAEDPDLPPPPPPADDDSDDFALLPPPLPPPNDAGDFEDPPPPIISDSPPALPPDIEPIPRSATYPSMPRPAVRPRISRISPTSPPVDQQQLVTGSGNPLPASAPDTASVYPQQTSNGARQVTRQLHGENGANTNECDNPRANGSRVAPTGGRLPGRGVSVLPRLPATTERRASKGSTPPPLPGEESSEPPSQVSQTAQRGRQQFIGRPPTAPRRK